MEKGTLLLLELLLIVGVVFGFGFWQLASLNRDAKARDRSEGGSTPVEMSARDND